MKQKLFFSILSVILISVITVGVTYAYYVSSNAEDITGEAEKGVTTTLSITDIHNASSKLVPLEDSLVQEAISKANNPCKDNSKFQYNICSLYKITLTNTEETENLYGYIKTTETTYTTENLKYQVFDLNYNNITDVMTLSQEQNGIIYFEKNNTFQSVSSTGDISYYLVIWLTETGEPQSDDYSKTFSGKVGFELVEHYGTGTNQIEASFNA